MQRAAQHWVKCAVLATCLLPAAHAQTPPPAPPIRPDTVKAAAPTFVADTARQVVVVSPEPSDAVTRPLALRIAAAIVVITLSTLLLYNVRSR